MSELVAVREAAEASLTSVRRPDSRRPARGQALAGRIGWNTISQSTPLIASVCLTPFVVAHLGLAGYGVWALVMSAVTILRSLDAGIGQGVARYVALRVGKADESGAARMAWLGLAAMAALSGPLLAGLWLAAPLLTHLSVFKSMGDPRALSVIHHGGVLVVLALVANVPTGVLQGHGRFRATAAAALAGQVVNAVLVVAVLARGGGLVTLLLANAGGAGCGLLFSLALCSRHLARAARSGSLADARELWAYGWRIQLTGASSLVNLEADALIVACFLPARFVGYYALGATIAGALREAPIWSLAPMYAALAQAAGRSRNEALSLFHLLQETWFDVVAIYVGATLVAAPAMALIWVPTPGGVSAAVAVLLVVGNSVNLYTGMASGLVRALGRPGLETRYVVLVTTVNVALTVPLTMAFGIYGVVGGTAAGQVLGSLAFVAIMRRNVGVRTLPRWGGGRLKGTAMACVAVAILEAALLATGVHGAPGLVLAALALGVVLAGTRARCALRRPAMPTPSTAR